MTITVSPLGDNLIAEHWSSRCVVTLTPTMTPDQIRRTMIQTFWPITDKTHRRLEILANPECYTKGAPSMIEVPPIDAEFVFGRPAAGRPGPEDLVLVDLPPLRREARVGRVIRKVGPITSSPTPPVRRRHLSEVVLDDVERLVVLALTHFRLLAAGHAESALRAASADYRESIVVTSDGRSGESLWWIGHASTLGVAVPTAKRLNVRFTNQGEPVLTPRKKQVS